MIVSQAVVGHSNKAVKYFTVVLIEYSKSNAQNVDGGNFD